MSRRRQCAAGIACLCLLLTACNQTEGTSSRESGLAKDQIDPRVGQNQPAQTFAMQVGVTARESEGWKPLVEARVTITRLVGAESLSGRTDERGAFGPVTLTWDPGQTPTPAFPYSIEVSHAGYKTCVVKYGGLILPNTPRWWESSTTNPLRIFVALPSGNGVSAEEGCYAGRGSPQTPGANKS